MRKFFTFIITGALALGLFAPIANRDVELTAQAASGTGYTSATDVEYVKSGNYIANWGARDEDCVFLSKYANSFYTKDNDFSTLSQKSGGTSQSNAPQSELYDALQDVMTEAHTFYTYYDGNQNVREFYKYADCVKNDTTKVSLLYLGDVESSTWNSGSIWNQEHMWPKSKLSTDKQIGDLMQLRPANPSENSRRGNTAYGESSGYYDPDQNGQNVRGDCARLVLYMYVRWGTTSTMWGSSGVMENLSVLLDWMEEDPVDTWEMGRNDAVQSITGTRNVFVDYPEYAWLLFGKNIPKNMSTPSGIANGGQVTPPSGGGDTDDDGGDDVVEGDPLASKIVTAPVVGKAYHFYMYQGNAMAVAYLAGGMDGYYLATTANVEDALAVYLENASNGYYLYCYVNGVKTYINMVPSGNFVNGAYEATASTVYTFNTTYNTLVNAEGYFFGTRNDKSYTTMGPCENKYIGSNFLAHFVESGLPNDPGSGTPDVPDTPSGGGSESCAHEYGNWFVVKQATETEDGRKVSYCGKCNDKRTEIIPKTGSEESEDASTDECEHEYGEWAVLVKPTETKEGTRVRFCEKCLEEERETIPVLAEDANGKEDGCNGTVGAISFSGITLLALGLYLRKKREA